MADTSTQSIATPGPTDSAARPFRSDTRIGQSDEALTARVSSGFIQTSTACVVGLSDGASNWPTTRRA